VVRRADLVELRANGRRRPYLAMSSPFRLSQKRTFTEALCWRLGALIGHAVVKHHDTDVGLPCPLLLPVLLEEVKGSDDDVLAASRIGGRGRVGTGSMERPARNGAVGHRVIAFEHRDLGRLLLREPVPLVVRTVGEAGGLVRRGRRRSDNC